MNSETEKIFSEQISNLPSELVDFISSTSWDTDVLEIGSLYNLSEKEQLIFEREVTLVLVGLIHPDDFLFALEKEVGTNESVLEAIVANVEKKIFTPIRPTLIAYFEKESETEGSVIPNEIGTEIPQQPIFTPQEILPSMDLVKKSSFTVPENLPVAKENEEPLFPPIPPKVAKNFIEEVSLITHPFEEQPSQAPIVEQNTLVHVVEEAQPQIPVPIKTTPPVLRVDPYREAIE